jgi:hypothetical protein
MDKCVMIDRRTTTDGRGGLIRTWVEGATFFAATVLDSSLDARVAESQGVKAVYTVTTSRAINLQFHDVFRREEDGKIFRVTDDGDDKKAPPTSTLRVKRLTLERWELPDD